MKNNTATTPKKPWWKRWWFITIVVVVLIFVFLAIIGSNAEPKQGEGLSEETKMEIYKELSAATERASNEAYEQYPTDPNNPRYSEANLKKSVERDVELVEKYVGEVRSKYSISEETELAIMREGVEKRWPMK